MAVFGINTPGGGTNNSSNPTLVVSRFQANGNGIIQKLTTRHWLQFTGTGYIQAAIYADNAGSPGALLAVGDMATFSSNNQFNWVDLPLSGANKISITNGTWYWLGHFFDRNASSSAGRKGLTSGTGLSSWVRSNDSAPIDPWSAGTEFVNQNFDIYATYDEGTAYTKGLTETMHFGNVPDFLLSKSYTESFELRAQLYKTASVSYSDSLSLGDVVTNLVIFGKSVINSLSISSVFAVTKNLGRSFSETLHLNDIIHTVHIFYQDLNDSAVLGDTVGKAISYGKRLLDSIKVRSTFTRVATLGRSLTESTVVNATIVPKLVYLRELAESIVSVDTLLYTYIRYKNLLESISIGDLWTRIVDRVKHLRETLIANELYSQLLNGLSMLWRKITKPISGLWTKTPTSDEDLS